MLNKLKNKPRKKPSSPKTARRHSARPPRPASKKHSLLEAAPKDAHGFVRLLLKRVSWDELKQLDALRKHPAGRPTHKLPRSQLLVGLLFHYSVHWAGTFAEHLLCLGLTMSDSALSERRTALPFAVFVELLGLILRPLGAPQPLEALYLGLKLVALDASEFSLANTAAICRQVPKARNHRGAAAFAKLRASVLIELCSHNPLGARLGLKGESEWNLSEQLLSQLPARCLLLGDRLYGCGAFLLLALEALCPLQGHFLIRARSAIKAVRVLRKLTDGSRIVEIEVSDAVRKNKAVQTIQVRQIVARVRRAGFRSVTLKLWTSLLDEKKAPAQELAALYARRWEHELYFRELKHMLGVSALLRSQTVETAAQEVAAMIVATALVAGERAQLKPGEAWDNRVSFIKTWQYLEPLWLTLELCGDFLSPLQKRQMAERFYDLIRRLKRPKKRKRSCPRVVCKPLQKWPKRRNQPDRTGPVKISIVMRGK